MSNSNRTKIVNINLPTRVMSASDASNSQALEDGSNNLNRPSTHHGYKPTAPTQSSSRTTGASDTFLSPRQIAIKLATDSNKQFPSSNNQLDVNSNKRHENHTSNSIEKELPSFIKKSLKSSSNDRGDTSTKTGYPSLANRLNATIVTSRPMVVAQSSGINYSNANNRTDSNNNTNKLLQLLNNKIQSSNNSIRQVPPQQQQQLRRPMTAQSISSNNEQQSIDFHSELELTYHLKQQTAATKPVYAIDVLAHENDSTVFEGMDIEHILDYLLDAREKGSRHAPFIHVTPRYHVEDVKKKNFYDLAILERPGHPKSGAKHA